MHTAAMQAAVLLDLLCRVKDCRNMSQPVPVSDVCSLLRAAVSPLLEQANTLSQHFEQPEGPAKGAAGGWRGAGAAVDQV